MILPVPSGAIQVLDLSKNAKTGKDLFTDLKRGFPKIEYPQPRSRCMKSMDRGIDNRKLVVKSVGSYFVSVAPTFADLARIDPATFKVPNNIQEVLMKNYGGGTQDLPDFSFVICRFKTAEVSPHPIGYIHERMPGENGLLFCPTRHAHGNGSEDAGLRKMMRSLVGGGGGGEHEHADWDHDIYSWGCDKLIASSTSRKSLDGGETPIERGARLQKEAQDGHGELVAGADLERCCEGIKMAVEIEAQEGFFTSAQKSGVTLWPNVVQDPTLGPPEAICLTAENFDAGTQTNFDFMYDTTTAQVVECLPGGLAEKHNLLNWTIAAFWNPAGSGKKEVFNPENEEHAHLIRYQRPLTVEFVEGSLGGSGAPKMPLQPLRHVEVKKEMSHEFPNEDLLFQVNSCGFKTWMGEDGALPSSAGAEVRAAGIVAMGREWIGAH
eukprot:gnl/TRDRNA2_/TRDRNA2_43455_c0_seq1.p1 gnl/TRDRNA2_/TRDRNA2_43455_c0~~gnl/TRDRNA2_/TRDRNA2_43455_c0_seq1.p1  ORF type:complete len:502 (-),score=83.96 gnl/TRDRNA2_/TRDRNA2_43455_c0_seq1:61-1371(-)